MMKILNEILSNPRRLTILMLGLAFFCFSISAALLFQKLLLPNLTAMLAPGTTLTTDSAYFDSVAFEMAQNIKQYGWSKWELFPNESLGLHVSILSALYVVFGHDATVAIPINGLFHALGGIIIFMIVVELSSSYVIGLCAGVVASCLFIIFPSALNWYGQIHKDGYAIVGLLAMLLIWCKAIKTPPLSRQFFFLAFLSFLVLCFLTVVRAYYFKLLLLFVALVFVVMIVEKMLFKRKSAWVFFLLIILTFAPAHAVLNSLGAFSQIRSGEAYASMEQVQVPGGEQGRVWEKIQRWKWQSNDILPSKVDQQIETVAKTRVGLIAFGISSGASSMVDVDKLPNNSLEVIKYLPRAFQVALLAPFPINWIEKISVTRLLASAEMAVVYIGLIGLIPLFLMNRSPQVMLAFFFSSFFLSIYGFTIANIGTLYRVRYPFEMVMMLLGIIGWFTYLDKKRPLRSLMEALKGMSVVVSDLTNNVSKGEEENEMTRKSVINSGVMVSFLTFLGFVGFFLRDVLMAHEFGFGEELDDFFLALLLPMFIVSVFCSPLGAAFVPFLNRTFKVKSDFTLNQVVSHLVSIVLIVMFFVSVLLYFFTPTVLNYIQGFSKAISDNATFTTLLILSLVILMFSGVVIIGNAVLTAKHRLVVPSAAQMAVPVIAILALVLFGSRFGVVSVMAGMVVGQLVNLAIIKIYLKKFQTSLIPQYNAKINNVTSALWVQYFPLLASAFFAAVILPIDTLLASTLNGGGVSIFNLGMKIVLFISGLLGAVVSNVMLPYFSSIVERRNPYVAKKELSFFILMATFISVPASIVLYIWAEQLVGLILSSSTISESDLGTVKSVMQYSLVQVPFFICNILLLKYATATRHLSAITISAFIGLLLNIALSLLLMPKMGVSGIALATSIAMIVSSVIILTMLTYFKHVGIVDTIAILLNWMLFLTLIVALHFFSMPSIVMIVFTYGILLLGYFKLINHKGAFFAA